ncbi:MAG: hypothetical protein ACRCUT_12490, partial [Spirochaetota bacterium]
MTRLFLIDFYCAFTTHTSMISYKHWIALERAQGIGPAALKEIHDTLDALSLSVIDIFDCTEQEIRSEFSFSEQIIRGI